MRHAVCLQLASGNRRQDGAGAAEHRQQQHRRQQAVPLLPPPPDAVAKQAISSNKGSTTSSSPTLSLMRSSPKNWLRRVAHVMAQLLRPAGGVLSSRHVSRRRFEEPRRTQRL